MKKKGTNLRDLLDKAKANRPNTDSEFAYEMLKDAVIAYESASYDDLVQKQMYSELAIKWFHHVLRSATNADDTILKEILERLEAIEQRPNIENI